MHEANVQNNASPPRPAPSSGVIVSCTFTDSHLACMYLCKKAMTSIRTCRLSPSYNSRWICKFILNWPTICGHAQSVLLAPSHVCKEIVETHTKRKCVRSSPGRAWQRLYHPRHTSQIACRCGRNDQTGSSNRAANCLTIRWTQ